MVKKVLIEERLINLTYNDNLKAFNMSTQENSYERELIIDMTIERQASREISTVNLRFAPMNNSLDSVMAKKLCALLNFNDTSSSELATNLEKQIILK